MPIKYIDKSDPRKELARALLNELEGFRAQSEISAQQNQSIYRFGVADGVGEAIRIVEKFFGSNP